MPRQTYFAKTGELDKTWHHVDADGKILGRIATEIATILMGKHRPEYTPHVDSGDCVIVTNAQNVVMTGRKLEQKTLQSFSGYPGGQKVRTYADVMEKHPERLIELAVTRMLPKGRLGRQMSKKLHVYTGADHPHQAQQPMTLEIN
ncbi:MAG: 50S ribosomal protein L13 [Planctomycetaceae bacterium]|nr:50S ribosomal protein L13 [Planctomycetaceae bacterium]